MARAQLDGAVTASIHAVEADTADTGGGLVGLLEGGLLAGSGVAAADPGAVAILASVSPEWAHRFPHSTPADGDQSLGRAFREALRAIADEEPTVLFVDDAHYLDEVSLRELHSAVAKLTDLPVLLCITVASAQRPAELDDLSARLGRNIAGVSINVGALSRLDLQSLCRWAMPNYDEAQIERLAERIEVDSGGLPILAVEILHAVTEGLDLTESRAAWPQPLRTLDQTLPAELPAATVGAIRVGFRRLTSDAQQLLRVAAVLGGRLPRATLERIAGISGEGLDQALDELEWERWLSAESRGYSFVARIVRNVVLDDMVSQGQRARIQEAAAQPT